MKLLFPLLFVTNFSFCQGNYEQYHRYMNLAMLSDNKDSIRSYYEQAFETAIPFVQHALNYSRLTFVMGDTTISNEWLEKAVLLGFQYYPDRLIDSSFSFSIDYSESAYGIDTISAFGKYKHQFYSKNYVALRKEFLSGIKSVDYYEFFLALEANFQDVRFGFRQSNFYKRKKAAEFEHYLMRPSTLKFIQLMELECFPKRRASAHFNDDNISLLLIHLGSGLEGDKEFDHYFDLLWKLVEKGEITPWEYASAHDMVSTHVKGKKYSTYGMAALRTENGRELLPVLNPEELNQRRKEKWLIPVEDYCKLFNTKLPSNFRK